MLICRILLFTQSGPNQENVPDYFMDDETSTLNAKISWEILARDLSSKQQFQEMA